MNRLVAALGIVAGAAAGGSALADGASTSKPAFAVRDVLGPRTTVPPGNRDGKITSSDFSRAYAFCPKGYVATGGGVYSGAITEVASAPTSNRRGWFVDGFNPSRTKKFQHRVAVVCTRGSASARASAASVGVGDLRRVEAEYAARTR